MKSIFIWIKGNTALVYVWLFNNNRDSIIPKSDIMETLINVHDGICSMYYPILSLIINFHYRILVNYVKARFTNKTFSAEVR